MPIGTRHDATKVMMGASLVPAWQESTESVPGDIAAGLAVRKATADGSYQVASDGGGPILGISKGRSLGKAGTFSLCYKSPKALIQLGTAHEPTVGTQVHIDDANGKTKASGGGATAINAVYEKLVTGIDEVTGNSVPCAIINFTGGA